MPTTKERLLQFIQALPDEPDITLWSWDYKLGATENYLALACNQPSDHLILIDTHCKKESQVIDVTA